MERQREVSNAVGRKQDEWEDFVRVPKNLFEDFKAWDEFMEFEVNCAEDEGDLVQSILTWVRTRRLLGTNRAASLLELSEAAEKSW